MNSVGLEREVCVCVYIYIERERERAHEIGRESSWRYERGIVEKRMGWI